MHKKFNFASAIGILITVAGFAIDAIQSAIAEKRNREYISECVAEEVKKQLESPTKNEESVTTNKETV